jgi:hypothetical protein
VETNAIQAGRRLTAMMAVAIILLFGASTAGAQAIPAQQDHGFTAFEQVRAIDSDQGQFAIIDTSIGYDFNRHVGIDIGEPVFFIRPTVPGMDHHWNINGGDPYADLRLAFDNSILNYATSFTATVPVHGTSAFSTGRVGLDWFNHFDHPIYRLTPFVNGGISNGIIDTNLLSQPFRLVQNFRTLGFLADAEGGMTFRVAKPLKIGGSYYALLPGGDQKVFINGVQDLALLPASIGPSNITHDRGYTAFVRVTPTRYMFAEAAYVHSLALNQDAATVTLGFDLRSIFGRPSGVAH